MNVITTLLAVALLAAILAPLVLQSARANGADLTDLANISGGAHSQGVITRTAEVVFGSRYLLGKAGTSSGEVAICAADDIPLFIVEDEPSAGAATACAVLGNASGTRTVVASGAIAENETVITDAGGKVQSEADANAGTYYRVGRALVAADADGEQIEIAHQAPVEVTIV